MKNFIIRALTGILFAGVMVGGILLHPLSFGLLFMFITILTVFEFSTLINRIEGVKINRLLVSLGGGYLFLAFMGLCMGVADFSLFIPYIILQIYLMVSELYLKRENPIHNWAYSMFSQLYVAFPLSLINFLAFQTDPVSYEVTYNAILPLSVFIFIWLSDSGAYCTGMLFGKHRLFERISPKKSWEGSIGGAVFAVIAALVLAHFFPTVLSLPAWIGLALTVVIFGTWGDLSESLLKRHLGIKDSGNMLPGHGGFLDRFDSTLIAVPAAVVYLYILYSI